VKDARLRAKVVQDRVMEITDQLYEIDRILRGLVKDINEGVEEKLELPDARLGYRIAKLDGKGTSLSYVVGSAVAASNKIRQTLDQYLDLYEAIK